MLVTILYLLALVVPQGNPVNLCPNYNIDKCWRGDDCKKITFNNGTTLCIARCKFYDQKFCTLTPLNKDGTGHCIWTPASGDTPASCGGDENVKEDNPLPACSDITSKEKCWENSDCKFITFNNGTMACKTRCKFWDLSESDCTAVPLNKDGTGYCVWTPASGNTPASCGGDENVKEDNPLPACINITSEEKCWENSDCKFITFNNGTTNCTVRCKYYSDQLNGQIACIINPLNKDGTGYCIWTPASGDTPASCGGDENVKEDIKDDPLKNNHSHITLIPLLLISLFVSTFL